MSPGTAMVALAEATGELPGWISGCPWLDLSSQSKDSHCFTINEIRMLCSALRHMDAVWRLDGCECLPGAFFQWLLRSRGDPSSLWEGAASVVAESAGVTTQAL